MTSNKLSGRRQRARKPPICISKPPPKPYQYPPYPPLARADPNDPEVQWFAKSRLPPVPLPPYRPIKRRNLIYHVFPQKGNAECFANLLQIKKRWHLFNARRVVAIATGPGLVPPDQIESYLGPEATYIHRPNDERLRETATFLDLLRQVRTTAHPDATFYAHTKGTSPHHAGDPEKLLAIDYWRNRMYHELLDDWPAIANGLREFATIGCLKIDYSNFPDYLMESPTGLTWGNWHYAGNFFWFRHDCIFRNPHWSEIADDPYAGEMWLGALINTSEAGTIYQPWNATEQPPPDLYDPTWHLDQIP